MQSACDCGSTNSNAPCTGNTISTIVSGDNRSITFNWTFNSGDQPIRCGQFANGDYWISPAAGHTIVTLESITGEGGKIFADENPVPEGMGFLGVNYGNQVAAENIIPSLPQNYSNKTSLVAGIERNQVENGKCGTKAILGGCIDAYQVITILDMVPQNAGSTVLRPNIIRPEKELMDLSDFDFSRLPSRSFFTGVNAEGIENIRKLWAHHIEIFSMRDKEKKGYSEGGRAFRADLVTDDYAASVARTWHDHLAVLMSQDHSLPEIIPALASMLTYGKDIYYHTYTHDGERERWFGVGAGQSLGRFPAAVFFAAMARNTKYGDVLKLGSSTQINIGGHSIHELDQVNIGPNGPVWGDGDANVATNQYESGRYWGEMLVGQEFNGARFSGKTTGQKTKRDPYGYIDGPGKFPGGSYAGVSAGPIRGLAAEMLLMPEVCEIVNYDAIVEYSLRLTSIGRLVDNDPCAPPDPRELTGDRIAELEKAGEYEGKEIPEPCDTYRARNCKYYGLSWDPEVTERPTWGPDPDDRTKCIVNGNDPITDQPQTGRFSQITTEQRIFGIGYKSLQIEANWGAIHAGRSSCRNVVSTRPKPPSDLEITVQ